jgi:5-deoxy-glucuronate isomerase
VPVPEIGIHPRALPNDLPTADLVVRQARATAVSVDPARARWRYLSYRSADVHDGESLEIAGPGVEAVVVVIGGGGVEVGWSGRTVELVGRSTPFDGLPWAAYVPAGDSAVVTGRPIAAGPVAVAVAEAPTRSSQPGVASEPTVITPDDVVVEIRGRGNASRQVNHIVTPAFPADRLLVVEVLTPGGNWSSFPPHKHDTDDMPDEAVLEEVYRYGFRRPEGWGVQRLYRRDETRDAIWVVNDGDVVLVTDGYHPFVAAHGEDAYYLNALAGDRRTMACSFDATLDWTRAAWDELAPDPRLPLVRPEGWPRPIDLPA